MQLWNKGKITDQGILEFTAGMDRELDLHIAACDVAGSMAHVEMLASVNLLSHTEKQSLLKELIKVYDTIQNGSFTIEEGVEDVHTQVEKILTEKLGDVGKKVHTARSRNDQVLTDLKLFYRKQLCHITDEVAGLVHQLVQQSERTKDIMIPGYTHFQAAMPSSFGMWFGAYAEALTEDLLPLKGALGYVNLNPLGSAAGYGSSFPVDRDLTGKLLEFEDLHVNSINAQMARGKTEKIVLSACGNIAYTLSKMSMDLVLFMSQNFGFVSLSEELTTGSSIMPHKKNPDVLELIRARCNRIQAKEQEVLSVIQNLPSGYHRDFQLLKEISFPAIAGLRECLAMMHFVSDKLIFNKEVMNNSIYAYLGSVDAINAKVKEGIPFREAYAQVAAEIDKGRFRPVKASTTTHTGSIGNLSNDRILQKLERITGSINSGKYTGFENRFVEHFKQLLK
jgi:argininosuccinate lyase